MVEEIPNASVGQDMPGWTEPAIGDESIAPWPDAIPAMPRAAVVPDLARGPRLYVTAKRSTRFALTIEAWRDGKVTVSDAPRGTGTGRPVRVNSRALR